MYQLAAAVAYVRPYLWLGIARSHRRSPRYIGVCRDTLGDVGVCRGT